MKKGIRKFKKKETVTIYESKHIVEIVFLEEGLPIGSAFHVCYNDVNLLDLDSIFECFKDAEDLFKNKFPESFKKGYASFIRYDNAPESEWTFLGYSSGEENE